MNGVIWQTVKTEMKCHISLGSALFAEANSIFRERERHFLGKHNLGPVPSIYAMDNPKLIAINQYVESVST